MSDIDLTTEAMRLIRDADHATVGTHSAKHAGFPHLSLMPYALDNEGAPLIFISSLSMHSKNLRKDPRASMFVSIAQQLSEPRATLIGEFSPVDADADDAAIRAFVARHPDAQEWTGTHDFSLLRLNILDIYFIGGFGFMGWVPADTYRQRHLP